MARLCKTHIRIALMHHFSALDIGATALFEIPQSLEENRIGLLTTLACALD